MEIIDISWPLAEGMVAYEGDPRFWRHVCSEPKPGDPNTYGMSIMTLGSHSGTHVDAPRHFVAGGNPVDELDLDTLCGPATVADVRAAGSRIDRVALQACHLDGVERLLLKTTSCDLIGKSFSSNYAHLTVDGAEYLQAATSVRLVGIDYLSVEAPGSDGFPVHHALLDGPSPVVIVEALDLRHVTPGEHWLCCLPLAVKNGDGAPARAVLFSGFRPDSA